MQLDPDKSANGPAPSTLRPRILPQSPLLTTPSHCFYPHSIQSAAKIQSRDLIRTRRYIQKFTQMRVQLQAVSLRMQSLRSNESMGVAMKGAARAMGQMNRSMNLPQVSE